MTRNEQKSDSQRWWGPPPAEKEWSLWRFLVASGLAVVLMLALGVLLLVTLVGSCIEGRAR